MKFEDLLMQPGEEKQTKVQLQEQVGFSFFFFAIFLSFMLWGRTLQVGMGTLHVLRFFLIELFSSEA